MAADVQEGQHARCMAGGVHTPPARAEHMVRCGLAGMYLSVVTESSAASISDSWRISQTSTHCIS